jgi:hypothetical protein
LPDVSEVLTASIFRAMSNIALIMEAMNTSETSVIFYQTTQLSIPEKAIFILAAVRT